MEHHNHNQHETAQSKPLHDHHSMNMPTHNGHLDEHSSHQEQNNHEHMSHENHGDHTSHAGHPGMNHGGPDAAKDFLRRTFIVAGLLFPLFAFSMIWPNQYIALAITTVIFSIGFVFFQHARHEIMSRQFGMMTLVSIAVGAGFIFSIASTFIPALKTEFNLEISTLILVLLFGHYLEAKSSSAAGNALDEVAKLLPKQAHVLHGDTVHDMDIASLKEGDIVLVKPGEKAPADGIILKGVTHFNEAHISGESKPVEKTVGDRVVAGAIAEDGSVEMRLDKVGENSTIGQIQRLIASAKQTKPSAQRIADKAASILTVTAVSVAVLTVLIWSVALGQPLAFSITLAITVLVIACPHALGLAIPTVSTIATKKAVNHGIFIKDMGKLEVVKKTNYVIFDKTGTLTEGSFGVSEIQLLNGYSEAEVLSAAASLEKSSSHVIGISIVKYAQSKNIGQKITEEFKNIAGKGIQAMIVGKTYFVGNEALMKDHNFSTSEIESLGKTVVMVANEAKLMGAIMLSDKIKSGAKKAIDDLHTLSVKVAMITGDNASVAESVAKELGVDTFFANVLPEDKYTHVKKLQEQGNVVIMVGDGVNDAPALTQANVGVAIGAGTEVAVEAGDIVLTQSNPGDISALIVLSRKVYQKMYQNLWWALGYNIIAIPAAAGVFIPVGFQLSPQVGAIAMALSSVIVVLNAMTLKKTSLAVLH